MNVLLYIYLDFFRFQQKRDKKRQSGSEGGRELKFSPINLKVLEILGENSAVVTGLPVAESSTQFEQLSSASQLSSAAFPALPIEERCVKRRRVSQSCEKTNEINELKKKSLEVDILLKEAKIAKLLAETEVLGLKKEKLLFENAKMKKEEAERSFYQLP